MELKDTKNSISKLFMPANDNFEYNPSMSILVKDYLKRDAQKILMIYGGNDPWTASAAQTKCNHKIFRIIQSGGSHRTRIGTLPEAQRRKVVKILEKWLR